MRTLPSDILLAAAKWLCVIDAKPLYVITDIVSTMATNNNEPIVRMTLRIPEHLINALEGITTHEDARSMNEAICNIIDAHIQRHKSAAPTHERHVWTVGTGTGE